MVASSWFSSTLTLPTLTWPANWSAILSTIGVSARHGPHHGAQKSTRTGVLDSTTSFFQLSVVNSTTFLLAIATSIGFGMGITPLYGRCESLDDSFGRP